MIRHDELSATCSQLLTQLRELRADWLGDVGLPELADICNPFLLMGRPAVSAPQLVALLLDDLLDASEEEWASQLLMALAARVVWLSSGGRRSTILGNALEFERNGQEYLVVVESGLARNRHAKWPVMANLVAAAAARNTVPVLGVCCGESTCANAGNCQFAVGEEFWHLIANRGGLYAQFVEPFALAAFRHDGDFYQRKAGLENRLAWEFMNAFCFPDGAIAWPRVVAFKSGSLAPATPPACPAPAHMG